MRAHCDGAAIKRSYSQTPRAIDPWIADFFASLAEEAEAGIALLRLLKLDWFTARSAARDRRRDSHAAVAVVPATSLAQPRHRGQGRRGAVRHVRRMREADRVIRRSQEILEADYRAAPRHDAA
ncbi:MAG TPA: hypothetical protein VGI28_01125 [Stellaceae bacterium]